MDNISQKNINNAVRVLKDNLMFEDAQALENAQIIPNLYILKYLERIKHEIKEPKFSWYDFVEMCENTPKLDLTYYIHDHDTKLEFLRMILDKAWARKGLICDFDDTQNPKTIIGKCMGENHYENVEEIISLTQDEKIEFDEIYETWGWRSACEKFDYKLNPDNQELELVLGYDEEARKYDDNEPTYVCKICMERLLDDCEYGGVTCDMEMD